MIEFLRFSLISASITTAAGIVMWYFSRYDFDFKDIYNDGLDLYRKNQYKAALNKFKLAVSKFPDKFPAHYNSGLCSLRLKAFNQAKESFAQALQLNPKDVDTIYNMGYTELCLNNFEAAKEHFLKILKSYPDESDVLFNLGYIATGEEEYQKANEYIAKAIDISPEKTEYKRYYVEILEYLFDRSGSPKLLEKMLDLCLELLVIFPNDENLIYKTAVMYAKMGDWGNSVTYCERMFSQNQNSYKACSQYGLTLFCKGETSRAIEMYERAIKLAPDIPDSYMNLVFAYDKIGEYENATALVENFIKKFPKEPSIELAKDYLERRIEAEEENSPNAGSLPESISHRKRIQEQEAVTQAEKSTVPPVEDNAETSVNIENDVAENATENIIESIVENEEIKSAENVDENLVEDNNENIDEEIKTGEVISTDSQAETIAETDAEVSTEKPNSIEEE